MTFIIFGAVVGACSLVAWFSTKQTSDQAVAVFAEAYAVPLTEGNVTLLRRALQRSRRFRLAGGLLALGVGAVVARPPEGWEIVGYLAAGVAVGSLADELTRRRPQQVRNAASLERRTLRTYVERWVIVAVAVAIAAVVAQVAAALRLTPGGGWFMVAPDTSPNPSLSPVPSTWAIDVWGACAIAIVVVGGLLLRRLVQAPRQAESADRAAVHHAIRTAAVLSVTGAMMMLLGIITLTLATATTQHDGTQREWFRWVDNVSLMVGGLAALIGMTLSLRAIPRRSGFGRLPTVPSPAEPS